MLTNKVALITGGGTGIGRAIALQLASSGVNTALNYSRSEEDATTTSNECTALGAQSITCQADVANDSQVRKMVAAVVDQFGQLDILVNNAGCTFFVEMEDLEGLQEEHWNRIMDVNVKGLFQCSRAAYPELKKQKGCIVNITSVAGLIGQGASVAYAASKAAAISVTKSLARVMAPEVRVNSIAPGIVQTRWVEGHEAPVNRLSQGTPLGRIALPADIAEVAHGLISQASFVTGQTVVVDGGMIS